MSRPFFCWVRCAPQNPGRRRNLVLVEHGLAGVAGAVGQPEEWKFTSFCIVASETGGTCVDNPEFPVTNHLPNQTMVVKDDHNDGATKGHPKTYHYKICTDDHGCSAPKIVNREA